MKRHQRAGKIELDQQLEADCTLSKPRAIPAAPRFPGRFLRIWHQFKTLARHYNVSMCWLFTAFLKSFGTPEKNGFTLVVKSYQKLEIAVKTVLRLYKTSDMPLTWDTI